MFPISIKLCLFMIVFKYSVGLVFGNLEALVKCYNGTAIKPYKDEKLECFKITNASTKVNSTAPVFTGTSTDTTTIWKNTGSNVTFECESNGSITGDSTVYITWYKNNITPITRKRLPVTYEKWKLMMNDLVEEDSARYQCKLCDEMLCLHKQYDLFVNTSDSLDVKRPSIKKGYPGTKTATIRQSVQFDCPATVNTEYTTEWYKVYKTNVRGPSEGLPGKKMLNETGRILLIDDKLFIHNITVNDGGWYKCTTANVAGKDESEVGQLKVFDNAVDKSVDYILATLSWFVPVVLMLACISIAIFIVVYLKRKRRKQLKSIKTKKWTKIVSIEKNTNGYVIGDLQLPVVKVEKKNFAEVKANYPLAEESQYVFPVDTEWEINRHHLKLGKVLGEGEFGKVLQAEYVQTSDMPCTVAVKMLKESHSDDDVKAFVLEMEIMKMIGKHENIINLLGCCTEGGPLYVVVEFASDGCLRNYLKMHKPDEKSDSNEGAEVKRLTAQDLVDFSLQVARGMEYLSSRGCIHRDLAARNVLVAARALKVADFGLARDVHDSDYYRKRAPGKLPVRWMAPESLAHNYYTNKSDVWSFGVLLWEIMTFGNTPYAQIPVHYLYNYLRMGKRMEKPTNCGQEVYDLMRHCCSFNPDDRPTFTEIKEKLQEIYSNSEILKS